MRIESLSELHTWLSNPQQGGIDHSITHISLLVKEAQRVQDALNGDFRGGFVTSMDGQDRSDFARIEIPPYLLVDPTAKWIDIRLSNTSPLAVISDESAVIPSEMENIKATLERNGYIPVNQRAFIRHAEAETTLDELWYRLFDFD